MQLSLLDPRQYPFASREMIEDIHLASAIRFVRARSAQRPVEIDVPYAWPHVERIGEVEGRPAWAVDDGGERYVVVRATVFRTEDLGFAAEKIRTAAMDMFGRLNWNAAHPGLE